MREEPTWRIPFGVLVLLAGLIVYGGIIAHFAPTTISTWPGWIQAVAYTFLGVIWLLPLKRFLIWMETGRWSPPSD
ncbi:MAG: DUF2842 domain-containing protein [Erythrobacter sp.]